MLGVRVPKIIILKKYILPMTIIIIMIRAMRVTSILMKEEHS